MGRTANSSPKPCGLLLAGGASQRMGRPKALLRLPARSARDTSAILIVDQLTRLQAAGCARIACVLGADAEAIEPVLRQAKPGVIVCVNTAWSLGAFSSLQAGLTALETCPDGVFVLPIDTPAVSAEVFSDLMRGVRRRGPPDAVVPTCGGRGGHPIWLGAQVVARVLLEPPTSRLDHLLREFDVQRREVGDPGILLNVNTPEEWQAFLKNRP